MPPCAETHPEFIRACHIKTCKYCHCVFRADKGFEAKFQELNQQSLVFKLVSGYRARKVSLNFGKTKH